MSSTTEDQTYNGWANYETWCVNLWLSNDEPLYREALERTEEAMNAAEADQIEHPYWSEEQCLRYGVADMLRTWVRDELTPDLGATFAADLLGSALDNIHWEEIADSWIEQVVEQS